MNENVRIEVLFQIRDARGLNAKEKAFLFVTESRGIMYSKWDNAAADMGLSKRGYYDARASLLSKGLLIEDRNYNSTTVYTVNADAFPYGEQDSRMGNDHSHSGNDDSRSDETKVTTKGNHEGNLEGNQTTTVPDGPVDPIRTDGELSQPSLIAIVPSPSLTVEPNGTLASKKTWEMSFEEKMEAGAKARAYMARQRQEEEAAKAAQLQEVW